MPTLTLRLTKEEMALLKAKSERRGEDPSAYALALLKRNLLAPPRDREGADVRSRQADRLARQAALIEYIRINGVPETRADKLALAQRFNRDVRTIYRDVDLAVQALAREREAAARAS